MWRVHAVVTWHSSKKHARRSPRYAMYHLFLYTRTMSPNVASKRGPRDAKPLIPTNVKSAIWISGMQTLLCSVLISGSRFHPTSPSSEPDLRQIYVTAPRTASQATSPCLRSLATAPLVKTSASTHFVWTRTVPTLRPCSYLQAQTALQHEPLYQTHQ